MAFADLVTEAHTGLRGDIGSGPDAADEVCEQLVPWQQVEAIGSIIVASLKVFRTIRRSLLQAETFSPNVCSHDSFLLRVSERPNPSRE